MFQPVENNMKKNKKHNNLKLNLFEIAAFILVGLPLCITILIVCWELCLYSIQEAVRVTNKTYSELINKSSTHCDNIHDQNN